VLLAFVLSLGAVTPPASGQTAEVVAVKALPATVTVFCDPPRADVDLSKLTYTIAVDRGEPSAPQPSCKFTIPIATAGAHTVAIVARAARADGTARTSAPAVLDFKTEILVTVARNAKRVPMGKPVDAPFTDPDGHQWTLVGTDVQIDGKHAPDAGPCTTLVLAGGNVYVFGDKLWWLWGPTASPHWRSVGPELPK
jgi:hypothetical protein